MTKHSPAPWDIEDYGNEMHQRYAIVSEQCRIARVFGVQDKDQANAMLMAAAPDMFEALENLIDSFHESVIANHNDFPALKLAMQAVNKAKGVDA